MPAESHDTSDNDRIEYTAISSPDTPKTGERSSSVNEDCAERIRANDMNSPCMRSSAWDYSEQLGPKIAEKNHENYLSGYFRHMHGERNECAEKPLDFSKNSISSVETYDLPLKHRKIKRSCTITSQRCQENGELSSDDADFSYDREGYPRHLSASCRKKRLREKNYCNGSENTAFSESEKYRQKFQNNIVSGRNGLTAVNSSGSEDERHLECPFNNYGGIKSTHLATSICRNILSTSPREVSPPSQLGVGEMSSESTSPSENFSKMPKETNGFHIQELLHKGSPVTDIPRWALRNGLLSSHNPKEQTEPSLKSTNFPAQPGTSPRPSSSQTFPSRSTSPIDTSNISSRYTGQNHALNFPASSSSGQAVNLPGDHARLPHSRVALGMMSPYPELSGVMYPNMPTPFTTGFRSTGYAGEVPGYPPPIPAFPPATYNGFIFPQPYPQSTVAGQNQQKPKKSRPFKEIDTSRIIRQIKQMPTASFNLPAFNMPVIESNGPPAENSSPQSPDSPTVINSSSGNEVQETNEEGGRKKGRRIPPEEKDERYKEKRRKNNIAAKKSRDQRKEKEDWLANAYTMLETNKVFLEAQLASLRNEYAIKEQKLEMLTARLISFRERCDGRTKEVFEDSFKAFLPQPIG